MLSSKWMRFEVSSVSAWKGRDEERTRQQSDPGLPHLQTGPCEGDLQDQAFWEVTRTWWRNYVCLHNSFKSEA